MKNLFKNNNEEVQQIRATLEKIKTLAETNPEEGLFKLAKLEFNAQIINFTMGSSLVKNKKDEYVLKGREILPSIKELAEITSIAYELETIEKEMVSFNTDDDFEIITGNISLNIPEKINKKTLTIMCQQALYTTLTAEAILKLASAGKSYRNKTNALIGFTIMGIIATAGIATAVAINVKNNKTFGETEEIKDTSVDDLEDIDQVDLEVEEIPEPIDNGFTITPIMDDDAASFTLTAITA